MKSHKRYSGQAIIYIQIFNEVLHLSAKQVFTFLVVSATLLLMQCGSVPATYYYQVHYENPTPFSDHPPCH